MKIQLGSNACLKMNLQLFAEDGGESGVEVASAAGEQVEVVEGAESQTGVDDQAVAEPVQQNNFEKAFAKRLSAKEAEWQKKYDDLQAQYKDHDTYKSAAEYLLQASGAPDMLTLKEEIELARLKERAAKENVSPEVQKRLETLEAKAAKADEFEAAQKQAEESQAFETSLKEFSADKKLGDKQLDHNDLWKYMHEHQIGKPEVAYKAMKADLLEAQLTTVREDAVKEYLESKKAPKAEGAPGAAAQPAPATGGGFKGAQQRAAERIRASRTAE